MGIRSRKPTSPARRFQTVSDFSEITKSKPEKSLLAPKPKTGGRHAYGRTTSRHRGGGHKQVLQSPFVGEELIDPVLDRAPRDEPVDGDGPPLPDPVRTVRGLVLDGGVPAPVEVHDMAGPGQGESRASGSEGEHEQR